MSDKEVLPACLNCNATMKDGAYAVRKCTWCCKKYCNKCSTGSGCPHCGKYGEDWVRKIVSQEEYERSCGINRRY